MKHFTVLKIAIYIDFLLKHIVVIAGKEIWVAPRTLEKSKSGKVFCSHHCATTVNNHYKIGKRHFNYKGGMSLYRKLAFENYEKKCAICNWNDDTDILQVHHIDSNRKNNALNNLIILCPTCHFKLTTKKYILTDDLKNIIKNNGL